MIHFKKLIITPNNLRYYDIKTSQLPQKGTKLSISKPRQESFNGINRTSLSRTKRQVKLLVESNYREHAIYEMYEHRIPSFTTLTFARNEQNLITGNNEFGKFIKRLQYKLENNRKTLHTLKYIAVPEFQKRGAVHYHILFFNLPYNENMPDIIGHAWNNGFINNQYVQKQKVSEYLVKELVKKTNFPGSKKRYFCSRNLLKPIILTNEAEIQNYNNKEYVIKHYFEIEKPTLHLNFSHYIKPSFY